MPSPFLSPQRAVAAVAGDVVKTSSNAAHQANPIAPSWTILFLDLRGTQMRRDWVTGPSTFDALVMFAKSNVCTFKHAYAVSWSVGKTAKFSFVFF